MEDIDRNAELVEKLIEMLYGQGMKNDDVTFVTAVFLAGVAKQMHEKNPSLVIDNIAAAARLYVSIQEEGRFLDSGGS